MLTPLQLSSVNHIPSCHGCARDDEENIRMQKESLVEKRSQGKTELYHSQNCIHCCSHIML